MTRIILGVDQMTAICARCHGYGTFMLGKATYFQPGVRQKALEEYPCLACDASGSRETIPLVELINDPT